MHAAIDLVYYCLGTNLLRKLGLVVILAEVFVGRMITTESKLLDHLIRSSSEKLVERVEIVVAGLLRDHAGLLQQVVVDVTSHGVTLKQPNKVCQCFLYYGDL